MYVFDILVDGHGRPSVSLSNITAVGTRHNRNSTAVATSAADMAWIVAAFKKQALGASLIPAAAPGYYRVKVQ